MTDQDSQLLIKRIEAVSFVIAFSCWKKSTETRLLQAAVGFCVRGWIVTRNMSEIRDPLDRVSNSLRRAVSINKSQETDLRSTMSTIQRERRRSVNSWSLKQEKFIRAKQKFVPTLQPARVTSQAKSTAKPVQRLALIHGLSPKEGDDLNTAKEALVSDLPYSSGNRLPPLIVPGKRMKHFHPQGLATPTVAIRSKLFQDSFAPSDSQLRRARRVSEYKAALDTDSGTRSLQRRVGRFTAYKEPTISTICEQGEMTQRSALDQQDGDSYRNGRAGGPSDPSLPAMDQREREYTRNISHETEGKRADAVNRSDDSNRLSRTLPASQVQLKKAQQNWSRVRQSLKSIAKPSKPRDIGKLSLTEMTRLFEEIRECRYLRVGHNKGFRGDTATGEVCKCIACTVKDKTKLKNNMSAPQ